MEVKNWLTNNWDKLLGFFLSIILAGVVGFFTAVRATDKQVSELRSRIVVLETDSKNLIKPNIVFIDNHKLEIERLSRKLDLLEKENDIQKATYTLIDLKRDEERRKTVSELKALLDKP